MSIGARLGTSVLTGLLVVLCGCSAHQIRCDARLEPINAPAARRGEASRPAGVSRRADGLKRLDAPRRTEAAQRAEAWPRGSAAAAGAKSIPDAVATPAPGAAEHSSANDNEGKPK